MKQTTLIKTETRNGVWRGYTIERPNVAHHLALDSEFGPFRFVIREGDEESDAIVAIVEFSEEFIARELRTRRAFVWTVLIDGRAVAMKFDKRVIGALAGWEEYGELEVPR